MFSSIWNFLLVNPILNLLVGFYRLTGSLGFSIILLSHIPDPELGSTEVSVLFILNDNIPDGRDVSWIYDISPEKLQKFCIDKTVYVSGSRFLDMAVRLKYAGVFLEDANISSNLSALVSSISSQTVVVFPNYSAMLELRKLLKGRAIL
jgi:hypothetical protein